MAMMAKRLIFGSMGVAGLVIAAAVLDMVLGIPFSQLFVMDVMFILGAGLVLYMGYNALQDIN